MTATPEILAACGVPARYRAMTRATWEGTWFPELSGSWDVVLIAGAIGSGKTHVATALLAELIEARELPTGPPQQIETGYSPYAGTAYSTVVGCGWWDIQELCERLKPGARSSDEPGAADIEPEALMAWAQQAPAAVFDDLGVERVKGGLSAGDSGWAMDRMGLILRYRYNNALPTIVTSNLTPRDLLQREARIGSRLCSGVVLELGGRDRRLDRHRKPKMALVPVSPEPAS